MGEARQRWRLVVARPPGTETQRDVERAWEAAVRASGLPWAPTVGRPDAPRIAFAAPLPIGVAGDAELVDLFLAERLPIYAVRESLERVLPLRDRLLDLFDVWLGEPGLPSVVIGADYRVDLAAPDPARVADAVARFLAAGAVAIERRKGDRVRTVDLRRLVDDLRLEPGGERRLALCMRLRHDPDLGNGRPEDVLSALEELGGVGIKAIGTVRERLRLARD